jgi:hypothetical protein
MNRNDTDDAKGREQERESLLESIEDAHERIEGLFETLVGILVSRPESSRARRAELMRRVDEELRAQQRREERSLYSRLGSGDPQVRLALGQHRHLELLLHELALLPILSTSWERRVRSLVRSVEIHFEHEEREVFELAREERPFADGPPNGPTGRSARE